jgi:hypothetical protein
MEPITQALDKLQGELSVESHFGAVLPKIFVIMRMLDSFTPTHAVSLVSALQTSL